MKAKSSRSALTNKAAIAKVRRKIAPPGGLNIRIEHKPATSDSLNEGGNAIAINFATQFANMYVYDIRLRRKAIFPDILDQHIASDELTLAHDKVFEELKLPRGKRDVFSIH